MARRILVIDDEPDFHELIRYTLRNTGYDLRFSLDGIQGIDLALKEPPDLIILDVAMPKIDGYETCRRLREIGRTCLIPIIMLTGRQRLVQHKIKGMNIGADDYITKPFNTQELVARVEAVLRRADRDIAANPVTRLPGQINIEEEGIRRIKAGAPFAFGTVAVLEFKPFNDAYGFVKGDEVVRLTARFLQDALAEAGAPGDFLGHRGGINFAYFTGLDHGEKVGAAVIPVFERVMVQQYAEADRGRLPLMRMAIGLAFSTPSEPASSFVEMDQQAQTALRRAITEGRSCLVSA